VARKRSPARLVVALSVAAVLAVFLVYTAFAGGTPSLQPSQLPGHEGRVTLGGVVVGRPSGDAHAGGLRFALRDVKGNARVAVIYRGSVPDLFRAGREIAVDGRIRNGVFVAVPNTLVTKCPSKYSPSRQGAED
jgi:cytochrome c-type biogenesis protein CcmE